MRARSTMLTLAGVVAGTLALSGQAAGVKGTMTVGATKVTLVGGQNNTFSIGNDEYLIEITSTSPRLVGTIKTKSPVVDAGSQKAGLDATFDVAVTAR